MTFRLSVINPNSDSSVTEYLRQATTGVLPGGSAVDAVDCPESPPVIETALDDVLAAPEVVAAAMRAGLIDEYAIVTHPVLVGGGTPFFTALDNWVNLNLVETRTFPDGVVLTRYETTR